MFVIIFIIFLMFFFFFFFFKFCSFLFSFFMSVIFSSKEIRGILPDFQFLKSS